MIDEASYDSVAFDRSMLEWAQSAPVEVRDIWLRRVWAVSQIRSVQAWEMSWVSKALDQRLELRIETSPPAYVIVEHALPQPPAQIGLLAADAIHGMRASLDYLARQLVLHCGNVPTDRPGSGFPILAELRSGASFKYPGVSREVLAAMEAVQPYHAESPDHDMLSVLNWLANFDKHRLLNTAIVKAGHGISGIAVSDSLRIPASVDQGWRRLHDDGEVEILRVPVSAGELSPDAKIAGHMFGFVAWDELRPGAPDLPVSQTLISIAEHVFENVMPRFKQFIPQLPGAVK